MADGDILLYVCRQLASACAGIFLPCLTARARLMPMPLRELTSATPLHYSSSHSQHRTCCCACCSARARGSACAASRTKMSQMSTPVLRSCFPHGSSPPRLQARQAPLSGPQIKICTAKVRSGALSSDVEICANSGEFSEGRCPVGAPTTAAWEALASVMQVDELWTALECFNMNQNLGHRIVRGRKADALAMMKDLAQTARLQINPCFTHRLVIFSCHPWHPRHMIHTLLPHTHKPSDVGCPNCALRASALHHGRLCGGGVEHGAHVPPRDTLGPPQ